MEILWGELSPYISLSADSPARGIPQRAQSPTPRHRCESQTTETDRRFAVQLVLETIPVEPSADKAFQVAFVTDAVSLSAVPGHAFADDEGAAAAYQRCSQARGATGVHRVSDLLRGSAWFAMEEYVIVARSCSRHR